MQSGVQMIKPNLPTAPSFISEAKFLKNPDIFIKRFRMVNISVIHDCKIYHHNLPNNNKNKNIFLIMIEKIHGNSICKISFA